jgi:hypothetical protein
MPHQRVASDFQTDPSGAKSCPIVYIVPIGKLVAGKYVRYWAGDLKRFMAARRLGPPPPPKRQQASPFRSTSAEVEESGGAHDRRVF